MHRLRGSQDVEDLVQEVYLRLLRASDGESVKHPQAYIYRVASNVLYEFKYHPRRRLVTFDSEALSEAADDLEDETVSPEENYEHDRRQRLLAEAVAQLSPMQRAVFLLARHQDLSHEEIARRLNISVNTARVHLHRAISHCRQVLSAAAASGPEEKGGGL